MAWGWVINTRRRGGLAGSMITVVVDDLVINSTAKIKDGDVVTIWVRDVIGLIPAETPPPLLEIDVEGGTLKGIRRVDGNTKTVLIVVDDGQQRSVMHANHQGIVVEN